MSDASPPPWSKSELLAIQATGRHSHFDQASVVEGLPVAGSASLSPAVTLGEYALQPFDHLEGIFQVGAFEV